MKDLRKLFEELDKNELTKNDFNVIRISQQRTGFFTRLRGLQRWVVGVIDKKGQDYSANVYSSTVLTPRIREIALQQKPFNRLKIVNGDKIMIV